jgi:hypothetical protein
MADAVKMRMVIPFRFEKSRKVLSTKFGYRLIPMWPFSETNAAAMRTHGVMKPGHRHGACSLHLPELTGYFPSESANAFLTIMAIFESAAGKLGHTGIEARAGELGKHARQLSLLPTLDRQTAHHFLLHTAHGRKLYEHLSKKDDPMLQIDIMKLSNVDSVIEIAKSVIDDKVMLTEAQFTEILQGHAKLNRQKGESEAAAFSRIFSEPENVQLRQAHQITKGF